MEEILGIESIGIDENFFDLGGHSILAMRLVKTIDELFKKKIQLHVFLENNTIESIANIIRNSSNKKPQSSIIQFQKNSGKHSSINVYFIHPSGGNVFCYYELSRHISSNYKFYGIQFPFFEPANSYLGMDIKRMANYYLSKILDLDGEKSNMVFGGWSLGGAIAFEMACEFIEIKKGARAPIVAIIDYKINPTNDILDDAGCILDFVKKIEILSGISSCISYEELANSSTKEQSQIVMRYFKEIKIAPLDLEVSDFQEFLQMHNIHTVASNSYVPSKYPGYVLIIKAKDRIFDKNETASLGWAQFLLKDPEIRIVSGTHTTMMIGDNAKSIAKNLEQWLNLKIDRYTALT